MENSKKTYQEPDVTKVEFDFNEAIAFSGPCAWDTSFPTDYPECFD